MSGHATPRRRPILEEIEPRILYSADLSAIVGNAAHLPADIRLIDASGPEASPSTQQAVASPAEIVFVDTRVDGWDDLLGDIEQQAGTRPLEIVLLDAATDGIDQISATLAAREDITAVHIISHGGNGTLALGSGTLDSAALAARSETLTAWRNALTADADLLIYGCNVAADADGQAFVRQLGALTGADVAASTDLTGATALGADWTLEYAAGQIEARTVIHADGAWQNVLAITANGSATGANTTNSSVTPLTWSHTVASGSNRMLLVEVAIDGVGASVSSVTYGGVALTQVGRGTGNHAVEIWALANPTVGTANVAVNFSASTAAAAGATVYNGVDQNIAGWRGSFVSATGTGTVASVTAGSAVGDLVVDVQYWLGAPSGGAAGAGQTISWWQSNGTLIGGSTTESGAPSVVMSGNFTSSTQWEIGAVSLKAAPNSPPVVVSDSYSGNEDTTITGNVLANDTDPDNDALTATLLAGPSHGTLTLNPDGSFSYTPDANWNGSDGFQYLATDGVSGLVHYWALEGNAGDPLGGANGTLTGTTTIPGKQGDALQFDGIDDHVTLPDLTYNNEFSLAFYFRIDNNAGDGLQYFYSHGAVPSTGLPNTIQVAVVESAYAINPSQQNQLITTVWDGNDTSGQLLVNIASLIGDGQWHLYTMTVTAGIGTRVYVDGTLSASLNTGGDAINPVGPAYLGARSDLDATRFLNAGSSMDGVSLYNRSLGAAEIAALATSLPQAAATLTVNPVNDPPVLALLGGNANYPENAGAVVISASASITDPDSADFNGGSLHVYFTANGQAEDRLAIRNGGTGTGQIGVTGANVTYGGTAIGTWSGGTDGATPLVVSFNGNATLEAVQALARNITYQNVSDAPSGAVRSLAGYVTDGDGGTSNIVTGTLTVIASNDTPSTAPVTLAAIAEDSGPRLITQAELLANASDLEGDALTATGLAIASGTGTLVDNGNGTWTYTPAGNDDSAVGFSYTITDNGTTNGSADPKSVAGSATLEITPVNDAPVNTLLGMGASVPEDTVVTLLNAVTVADADAGGSSLSLTLSVTPAAGTLSAASGGGVTISGSGTATLTLQGSAAAINAYFGNASTAPVFTATADYNGTVSLTLVTSDNGNTGSGGALSDTDTVTGSISAVADIANDTVATAEDTPLTFDPLANDSFENAGRTITQINSTAIAVGASLAVAGGSVTLDAGGTLTFTPDSNTSGTSSFTYTVGSGGSTETATVNVTVQPVNDPPSGTSRTVTTGEDTPYVFGATDFGFGDSADTPANTLQSVVIATLPAAGNLTLGGVAVSTGQEIALARLNAGDLRFTPAGDANGNAYASFTFQVRDDGGTANGGIDLDPTPKTLSIDVTPINDAPTITSAPATAATQGVAYSYTVSTTDPDLGTTLTISATLLPSWLTLTDHGDGTATLSGTPTQAEVGSHAVSLKVSDGTQSTTQSFTLTVANVNDAPVVSPVGLGSINEDGSRLITQADLLAGSVDPDGDALTVVNLAIGTGSGTLTDHGNGTWTFAPAADWNGSVTFSFAVSDGTTTTANTASLAVTPVNDAPTITSDGGGASASLAVPENQTAVTTVVAADVDGDALSYSIAGGADAGRFAIDPNTGALVFNFGPNFESTVDANGDGVYEVVVAVSDGSATDSQTLAIAVTNVNEAPGAVADNLSGSEDNAIAGNVLANDTDPDGDALSATLLGGPSHGAVAFNPDGSFSYTPDADWHGSDSFTYTSSDGSLTSAAVTVTLDVAAVNDAPTGSDGTLSISEDHVGAATLPAASDVDGDTVAYALSGAAGHGNATVNADGSFSYRPDPNFNGSDSFNYTIDDGHGGTAAYRVAIAIAPVNDAPVGAGSTASTFVMQPLAARLPAATDVDGDPVSYALATAPGHGSVSIAADGAYLYRPAAGYQGTDSFSYAVSDGQGGTNAYTVALTVLPRGDIIQPPAPQTPQPPGQPGSPPSGPGTGPGGQGNLPAEPGKPADTARPPAAPARAGQGIGTTVVIENVLRTPVSRALLHEQAAVHAAEPASSLLIRQAADASAPESWGLDVGTLEYLWNPLFRLIGGSGRLGDGSQSFEPGMPDGGRDGMPWTAEITPARVAGVSLSVGVVWWTLRAGGLLASLAASLPTWRGIDVTMIVDDRKYRRTDKETP